MYDPMILHKFFFCAAVNLSKTWLLDKQSETPGVFLQHFSIKTKYFTAKLSSDFCMITVTKEKNMEKVYLHFRLKS